MTSVFQGLDAVEIAQEVVRVHESDARVESRDLRQRHTLRESEENDAHLTQDKRHTATDMLHIFVLLHYL